MTNEQRRESLSDLADLVCSASDFANGGGRPRSMPSPSEIGTDALSDYLARELKSAHAAANIYRMAAALADERANRDCLEKAYGTEPPYGGFGEWAEHVARVRTDERLRGGGALEACAAGPEVGALLDGLLGTGESDGGDDDAGDRYDGRDEPPAVTPSKGGRDRDR